jgi:trimethylamine--corrinoid protein Co-methyltransferase
MTESGVTFDQAQLVMDNEFIKMIRMVVMGIPVNDDTLMVDDIVKVGAFGDYLSLDSTLKLMRSLSMPKLLDRRVREDWELEKTDLYTRSQREAKRILDTHKPEPLPDDVKAQLRGIVAKADKEAGVGCDRLSVETGKETVNGRLRTAQATGDRR